MKGKNPVVWGALGLIFGPLIVWYLLSVQNAVATEKGLLRDRVNYFYQLGLLGNENINAEECYKKISRRFVEEWGKELDADDRFNGGGMSTDQMVLEYGSPKVWAKDTEADVLKGNSVYVGTLKEWGALSAGVFQPTHIVENWKTDSGPIEVVFEQNNKRYTLSPRYLEDYIDVELLKKINKILPRTGYRYEMTVATDQTAFVIWLSRKQKTALSRRGWRFAW